MDTPPNVVEAASSLVSELKKPDGNDSPVVRIRYAVVTSSFGFRVTLNFAGGASVSNIRYLAGATFSTGNTVVVLDYGADMIVLGALT